MRSCAVWIALAVSWPAHAQTLREAVEAAWARQPTAQARAVREAEFDARRAAARAFSPEPPSIGVSHLTDQVGSNNGKRESEIEVSVPLWLPGQRDRRLAVVEAEANQLSSGVSAAKWRIAGEVREAYWQMRLAAADLQLARRKVAEAGALRTELDKRFRAGDVTRLEVNQADSAEQLAAIALTEAQSKLARATQTFRGLTGLSTSTDQDVAPAASFVELDSHPALQALTRAADAAMTRLNQVGGDTRDPPEVSLGGKRERELAGEPTNNALFLRFKLPFATAARNQPRIAAANAELIEARAAYEVERRRLEADIEAARREYEYARDAIALAERRFALASDTQRLAARGFSLGEFDLVTRLRAEGERFDAELALQRARIEVSRAASKLNQAYGLLP
jgi:outer membrane protein, heavy metal efflux system